MSPEALVRSASLVRVGPSPKHGLGAFATEDTPAGTVVHVAPVMLMSEDDVETLETTPLRGLVYGWDEDLGTSVLALGYGSLFNHDPDPNCVYHRVDADDVDAESGYVLGYDALLYSTLRDVVAGEEFTIDYSGGDPSILWFEPA
jgi:uncharacterized protein